MYESIFFTVGKKTIELYGKEFTLGELTTQVLNIPVEEYKSMRELLEQAQSAVQEYEKSKDISSWEAANDFYIRLDAMLCKYPIFAHLKHGDPILDEASALLSDLIATGNHDFELSEKDVAVQNLIDTYEDYLLHPGDYGGEIVSEFTDVRSGEKRITKSPMPAIPQSPPPKTRNLLIVPGDLKLKWTVYTRLTSAYSFLLEDIRSFNNTIYSFIGMFLSKLEKLNPSNYAAALYDFLSHHSIDKLAATPWRGTGHYTNADPVMLKFIPKPVAPGSDNFQIYEYYEASSLQTFLKLDFYKALKTGHIIRRCEYCKRFFLLTRAYHTKYCDQPCPDKPEYTCAQVGRNTLGRKEKMKDDPRLQALNRCFRRIDQDVSRGIITDEERKILKKKAKHLHRQSFLRSGTTYEELDEMLQSGNLYPLCGVIRMSNPVGRPRKKKAARKK